MLIEYLNPDHAVICKILIDHLSVERNNTMRELGISFADDHMGFILDEEVLSMLMIKYGQYWNKINGSYHY